MTRADQLALWFSSRLGQRLLMMQRQALTTVLSRCFGHHALMVSPIPFALSNFPAVIRCYALIGQSQLRTFAPSDLSSPPIIRVDMQTLPFESASINAMLLHHTLDIYEHPHQLLREVERVLVPGGRLILVGFNPWSLWGLTSFVLRILSPWMSLNWLQRFSQYLPWESGHLSKSRLKDWLQLLNFEVDDQQMLTLTTCVTPSPINQLCKYFGVTYMLSGVKLGTCLTPIKPRWAASASRFGAVGINLTPARSSASVSTTQK